MKLDNLFEKSFKLLEKLGPYKTLYLIVSIIFLIPLISVAIAAYFPKVVAFIALFAILTGLWTFMLGFSLIVLLYYEYKRKK